MSSIETMQLQIDKAFGAQTTATDGLTAKLEQAVTGIRDMVKPMAAQVTSVATELSGLSQTAVVTDKRCDDLVAQCQAERKYVHGTFDYLLAQIKGKGDVSEGSDGPQLELPPSAKRGKI